MITAAIVTGSVAGRMRFGAVVAFLAVWALVVYAPLAHMVWGGEGSLIGDVIGALDFAGGDVVHISSGVTGLLLCLALGGRRGFGLTSYRPHNVPFVALGAGLLWVRLVWVQRRLGVRGGRHGGAGDSQHGRVERGGPGLLARGRAPRNGQAHARGRVHRAGRRARGW